MADRQELLKKISILRAVYPECIVEDTRDSSLEDLDYLYSKLLAKLKEEEALKKNKLLVLQIYLLAGTILQGVEMEKWFKSRYEELSLIETNSQLRAFLENILREVNGSSKCNPIDQELIELFQKMEETSSFEEVEELLLEQFARLRALTKDSPTLVAISLMETKQCVLL